MAEALSPTLRAVSDAVLAVAAAELSVEDVLQQLVDSARELASAEYAALGLPDGEGGFRSFLTSGMSDELITTLGELPRQHGVLGAMLTAERPYRTRDLHDDPRFRGWWPRGHPDMHSFLGVPIVAAEGVIGAFYLTEKIGAPDFVNEDEEIIGLLAAHAAIAISNARLYEQSRELSVIAERNRLALDLHDSVSQKLFGLVLTAEAVETLLERDPPAAREQVSKLGTLAREALEELRSLVFELRPADLERDGLEAAMRTHVEVLRRVRQREITLEIGSGLTAEPARDGEVFRIAQEALQNAIRHAGEAVVTVRLQPLGAGLLLEVEDNGAGFDLEAPGLRSRRLGLTSMEERARQIGGTLRIESAPGRGTTVRLETPVADPIRVLIADDHAVVREGLRAFLELQEGIEVVGEAADGREAVDAVGRLDPDVVLMDLVMPRLDGVGAMRALRAQGSRARVIVLTSFFDDEKLLPALRAGAAGYLLKNAQPKELVRAINAAHCGEVVLDPVVAARLVSALAADGDDGPLERLTPRELEVLRLIGRGFPNKRIAQQLGVTEKTVKTHVGHVFAKLGVTDRTQAAVFAVREGLIEPRS